MNLELMAMKWLRFERRCPIVIRERSPRSCIGRPDVLGVTASRYLIEIEIKRSVSDFHADARKSHRTPSWMDSFKVKLPKLFYYLVPEEIRETVERRLNGHAGLLYALNCSVFVARSAPVNRDSKRLSLIECGRLVHLMANHIISAENSLESIIGQQRYCDPYWYRDPRHVDFQI